MSSYRGRTGPNFSQYLTDLNTLSPPDQPFNEEDLSNDLAMYTNTDFTNLDIPGFDDNSFNYDMSPEAPGQDSLKYEQLLGDAAPSTDFRTVDSVNPTNSQQSFFPTYNTPIQPAPPNGFPTTQVQRDSSVPSSVRSRTNTIQGHDLVLAEEKSRVAAEEDKRRRNTAASARFRVKKKQREQATEKNLKDVQDKCATLEGRVAQLEQENKWLKDLITEKNGINSKEEMAAAVEKHRKESEERDLKVEPGHTSGIGTD